MYKIALTQVDFDNSYKNVLRFDTRAQQRAYFDVNTLFSQQNLQEVNYPFGTFYLTRVPIKIADTKQTEMLSYNYAIVKDMKQTDVYYYYFIKNANYDAGNTQMLCDLELDIFNTYYIDTHFSPCLINRAHLDRWGDVDSNGYVKFNGDIDSLLFEKEPITPPAKYLKERKSFALTSDDIVSSGSGLIYSDGLEFLDKHCNGWLYIYLNPAVKSGTDSLPAIIPDLRRLFTQRTDDVGTTMPYYLLVFPITDAYSSFKVRYSTQPNDSGTVYTWDFDQIKNYVTELSPYILDVCISQENPFPNFVSFNNGGTVILNTTSSTPYNFCNIWWNANSQSTAWVDGEFILWHGVPIYAVYRHENANGDNVEFWTPSMNTRSLSLPIDNKFKVSDIVAAAHNLNYNPKLLTEQYIEFRLGIGTGNPFVYDLLKMNDKDIQLNWRTTLTTGIQKIYIGAYPKSEATLEPLTKPNIYSLKSFMSFVGASCEQDTSIPYSINILQQYLANNKNFYMQRAYTMASQLSRGIMETAGAKTTAGAVVTAGETAVNIIDTYVNSEFTLSNMENAPEIYKAVDGNPLTTLGINKNKAYYEIWSVLPCELKIADANMNMNGYTYNQIDEIKNCDNIRYYWNYVQAQLENVDSTLIMSNTVRDKFKEIFARGVRFWNITDLVTNHTYNYNTHENYERRFTDSEQI